MISVAKYRVNYCSTSANDLEEDQRLLFPSELDQENNQLLRFFYNLIRQNAPILQANVLVLNYTYRYVRFSGDYCF